jgi:hypothetical protein
MCQCADLEDKNLILKFKKIQKDKNNFFKNIKKLKN